MNGRSDRRLRLLLVGAVTLAGILSLVGIPITTAQGLALVPAQSQGPLPVDAPFDAAWDAVRPVEVALSGQPLAPPVRLLPAFPSVRVRSLVDRERIAVLLEWDDPTADASVLGVDRFADAAAMQIALGQGTSICMGQQAGGLNIWHWKADWAADIPTRQDVEDVHPNMPDDVHFPPQEGDPAFGPDGFLTAQTAGNPRSTATLVSSVEDLNAVGFGTLTSQPPAGQDVHGASEYRDGTWRVVMSRALWTDDPNDAAFQPGTSASAVAFAVWDGSSGDRDGLKSVSSWLALVMPQGPPRLSDSLPFFVIMTMAIGITILALYFLARGPRDEAGLPSGRQDDAAGTEHV